MLEDCAFLEEHGILPEPGGRLDQHPKFLQALPIVQDEREKTARAVRAVTSSSSPAGGA